MLKRIVFSFLIAAFLIVGAGSIRSQETAIVPLRLQIPVTAPYLICDETEASWDAMTAGDILTIVTEDLGPLSRLMKVDPGNTGLTVGLSYNRTPLVGPNPNGRLDLIAIEATPGEFLDPLGGWLNRVDAGVESSQIPITTPCQTYWNLIFSFIEGFEAGEYTCTLTWTLAII